jgi:signal transduction histidine kinase/CheY-like chemotaxis protein
VLALAFTLIPLASAIADMHAGRLSLMSVLSPCVTMFACTLVLHRRRVTWAFLGSWSVVLAVGAFTVPAPLVDPRIAAIAFLTVAVLLGFAVGRYMYLREQQETAASIMEVLFDRAADGILFGSLDLRPYGANRRARDLFETDDLLQLRDLAYAAWRDAASSPIDGDETFDGQRRCLVRTAKGNVFWGDIVVKRVHADREVLLLARVTDISAQMQVETQMRAAKDAAEAAVQVRDRFLANVSHEIRTPMNGVIAMTSLVLNTRLDDQQHELMQAIRTSGETMLALINEILDFSKLEAGAVALEQQPFELEPCLVEAMGVVAPVACAKGLELVLDTSALRHGRFVGDVSRIRQVVVNLLSNAVKFTACGAVEVTATNAGGEGNSMLTLTVRDSGIGIAADVLEVMFEPFTQADASTTRRFGGTGLGLSICKSLVERMHGQIQVRSTPGDGSTFSVHLPLQPVAASAMAAAPAAHPGTTSTTPASAQAARRLALFVAHPALAQVCETFARQAGFEVQRFTTAAAALTAHSVRGDVALVEVGNEGLSPGRSTGAPLIGLLAFDAPATARQGLDAELRKPLSPPELRMLLHRAARGDDLSADVPRHAARPQLEPIAGPLPSVLLAEDNAINQLVGRRVLQSLGVATDVAANGREVLQMLRQRHYDVILMDVQMPEVDGIEATRQIRADAALRQPWIIAMTANVLPADRAACAAAGMDDFVGKPIRVTDVHQALSTALAALATGRDTAAQAVPAPGQEVAARDDALHR